MSYVGGQLELQQVLIEDIAYGSPAHPTAFPPSLRPVSFARAKKAVNFLYFHIGQAGA